MSSISDCPPAVWPSESSTQRLDDLAGHGVQPPATDQPPTTDQPPAVAAALFQESPDAWRSAEALLDELDRLIGREWQKKRDTVLALVDARLAGRSEETVWDLPQTCNRSTYHSKWKRNDPIFVDVLDKCTKIAKRHKDRKPARAVVQAGEYLQLAAPAAAGRMVALIDSSDEAVALRAAAAVLDRAGIETAPKAEAHTTTSTSDEWRQNAERHRREVDGMLVEMEGAVEASAEGAQRGVEGGGE